jgi:hypothetical protein
MLSHSKGEFTMFKNSSHTSNKTATKALNANKATAKAPEAYATPELVDLGKAQDLVQGFYLSGHFLDENLYNYFPN